MSFITTNFQEILLSSFRGVVLTNCFSSIFHFGQILSPKGRKSEKKNWIKISCGYAHLHFMSFVRTIKFHKILLGGFRGVALTRKTGLKDWLTDWLTDGSKHYTLRNSLRGYKKGHLNKFEYLQIKDALCQVWLKLAQWLSRRWKHENFTNSSSIEVLAQHGLIDAKWYKSP